MSETKSHDNSLSVHVTLNPWDPMDKVVLEEPREIQRRKRASFLKLATFSYIQFLASNARQTNEAKTPENLVKEAIKPDFVISKKIAEIEDVEFQARRAKGDEIFLREKGHKALRQKIPRFKCKPGCLDCCGPPPLTRW